ncbi:MAG: glycosyltransferase [Mogibacterium sp.]|nr:glycosyltransferase [Mogibacterium sp.]
MQNPTVSIIITVRRQTEHLEDCVKSIREQSVRDVEVFCVLKEGPDPGLKDREVKVLRSERFNETRNRLIREAAGRYLLFLEPDWRLKKNGLESMLRAVTELEADLVIADHAAPGQEGKEKKIRGVRTEKIAPKLKTFSYRDCRFDILTVAEPSVCAKLFDAAFIRKSGAAFDETAEADDRAFIAAALASADRIVPLRETVVHTENGADDMEPEELLQTIRNTRENILCLPHAETIRRSLDRFTVDQLVGNWRKMRTAGHADTDAAEAYYQGMHDLLSGGEIAEFKCFSFDSDTDYLEYLAVLRQPYDSYRKELDRNCVVSFTSYPARIHTVAGVIRNLREQSFPADRIVLYLYDGEFPGREQSLPEDLLAACREGQAEIRWCDTNLKPHKKYYYAFQDFPEDLVITVDDDLIYAQDMIEKLRLAHIAYPDAVATMRAHYIVLDENGEIAPYSDWVKDCAGCPFLPSAQLMATNGAGSLFPVPLLDRQLLDIETIQSTCPVADDIYLKGIELLSNVPTVLASNYSPLDYIGDTQENSTLWKVNITENDVQLRQLSDWFDRNVGKGSLREKLLTGRGERVSWNDLMLNTVKRERAAKRRVTEDLRKVRREKAELEQQLRKAKQTGAESGAGNRVADNVKKLKKLFS